MKYRASGNLTSPVNSGKHSPSSSGICCSIRKAQPLEVSAMIITATLDYWDRTWITSGRFWLIRCIVSPVQWFTSSDVVKALLVCPFLATSAVEAFMRVQTKKINAQAGEKIHYTRFGFKNLVKHVVMKHVVMASEAQPHSPLQLPNQLNIATLPEGLSKSRPPVVLEMKRLWRLRLFGLSLLVPENHGVQP